MAKHNEIITLCHPEHGTHTLTRKQFEQQFGLDKQDTCDLVNRRGKIRKGWSRQEEETWKSFYFSISQNYWNLAEKIAHEKGWTVEAVICDAAERQLSADITDYINH